MGREFANLHTDVPPPSEKSGEEDVCEWLSLIYSVLISPECWGKPLIGCNVNAMT